MADATPTSPSKGKGSKSVVASHHTVFNKKHAEEEEGTDAWLMTYADMITLILCFFVIMLSVSVPDLDKFEKLKQKLTGGFIQKTIEAPFNETYEDIQKLIEEEAVERDVAVERTTKVIAMDLNSAAFFEPGSALLRQEAEPLLNKIATLIIDSNMKEYAVEVEGHTDDVPAQGSPYPSIWELSSARAAAVVRFLIDKGLEPKRMKVSGYADTRPKVPNVDEHNNIIPENQVLNRRVVVKIEAK